MPDPWRLLRRVACPACLLLVLAGCATTGANHAEAPQPSEPAGQPVVLERPPVLVVEAIVVDKKGAPVDTLHVRDFWIEVDGRRRNGVALARLYQGPGASPLASSITATTPGEALPVAEPRRTVVMIVDQPSLSPGDERRAHETVDRCMTALGVSDRIAVLSLPTRAGPTTISFDRAAIRETLAGLRPLRSSGAEALNLDAADVRPPTDDALRAGAAGALDPATAEARDDMAGPGDVSPAALKAHALSSLGGLRQILRALRQMPGGKTILLLSAGLVATAAAAELRAVTEEAARAQARIFVLQVPSSAGFGEAGARDLHLLAQDTGGRVVPLTNKPEQALDRLAAQLAFSYLLLLAPMPEDVDMVPHALNVTLPRRPDLVIQTAKHVFSGRLAPEALAASLSPRAIAESAAAGGRSFAAPATVTSTPSAPAPFRHDPALDLILARVAEYVSDYGRELSSVVSEETYTQETHGDASVAVTLDGRIAPATAKARVLVSDFLLVKVPGVEGWLPFRDVFEVDGERVRDRQDRLVKLFLQAPATADTIERATRIWRESARYNIGNLRTLNVPTLPLLFLDAASRHRFAFRKAGEETMAGTRVWVIEYVETATPTFITTSMGKPVVASGRIWVEPINGRIDRTLLKTSVATTAATITVTYALREELPGLWLPVEMKEQYSAGSTTITGNATYSKFRQFQVSTTEQIALPKK